MEMKPLIGIAAALAALIAVAPQSAHAADVSHLGQDSIQDFFQNSDPSGCVVTSVNLFGGLVSAQIPGGPASATQAVTVNVFQFDNCSSTFTFLSGSSADVAFRFG